MLIHISFFIVFGRSFIVINSTIAEVYKYVDQEVKLGAWVANKRSSGKIAFLQLRDGTGFIQAVIVKAEVSEDLFQKAKSLSQESSLYVTGIVQKDERSPIGHELLVKKIDVIHHSVDYPITPKEHGTEFLMDHRHLWLRSRRQHAILKVRHAVVKAGRDFLDEDGFTLMDAPIFTPAACEGTTTLFEVDYFDDAKAYLTQSGQLYNEATAAAFGKVYCFGPTFRAEKSKTRRHLTEFWMVEPEVAFATLDDIMNLAEEFLTFIVHRVLEN